MVRFSYWLFFYVCYFRLLFKGLIYIGILVSLIGLTSHLVQFCFVQKSPLTICILPDKGALKYRINFSYLICNKIPIYSFWILYCNAGIIFIISLLQSKAGHRTISLHVTLIHYGLPVSSSCQLSCASQIIKPISIKVHTKQWS